MRTPYAMHHPQDVSSERAGALRACFGRAFEPSTNGGRDLTNACRDLTNACAYKLRGIAGQDFQLLDY